MTGGGMPYDLEKGPTFSVIEDWANKATWQDILAVRDGLQNGTIATAQIGLDSVNLNHGPTPTTADRVKHVNEDWFGWHQDPATGNWIPQQDSDFDPLTHPETGYWHNYFGNVEAIWRTTLIRAAEVVLGLDHGQSPKAGEDPPRRWRVQFYWRCPTAWFQTWITWHGTGPKEGTVVVHIHSPGHGSPILTSPLAPPNRSGPQFPEHDDNPVSCSSPYGMWVTSQARHERHVAALPLRAPEYQDKRLTPAQVRKLAHLNAHAGTTLGVILVPTFGPVYEGVGDVVTVQPCEADGGVLPNGRPY